MKKTYMFAGISIFFWSTVATVSKLLLGDLTSFQVLSVSALFGGMFLLIVNIVTGNIKQLKNYTVKDYLTTALIGLPGTFFYYVFYYTGTSLMPASQAFIINYLWPIMSVVFACIILREKMTVRKGIAFALSFCGVLIVTGKELLHFNANILSGAVCCALGAVSYGIFTALNQKFKYDKKLSMMIYYFISFLLTGVINFASGSTMQLDGIRLLGLAYNGMCCLAIANTCWMLALALGNTAKVSNLAYITPFLSLVWTAVFLKEHITVHSVVGLAVIVLGILIQLKDKGKKA